MRRILLALLIASAGFVTQPQPAAAGLDPVRSEVRFTITKLGYSDVTGRFREFSGQLRYDPAHPENSSVQWRVAVASVETGERNRDRSLQNQEYFLASRYPDLSFTSHSVRRGENGALAVTGDITIRGVTKRITVPVRVTDQAGRRLFVTDFELDRYDFGVRGGTVMGRLIGRTVRVHLAAVEGGAQ